jgi:hypothetical protein
MRLKTTIRTVLGVSAAAALALTFSTVSKTAPTHMNLPVGKVPLTSAGPLAFGPSGILFVGDSAGAQIVAIDTKDTKPASKASINVEGVDAKIAALVGVPADQIVINDVVVNPISRNAYISASRGKGPDAAPLIARVETSGKINMLSLDSAPNEEVSLVDAPEASANGRRNLRMQTITDMNYVNGNLMVAGLSNEEWSSALRSIPFPFKSAEKGATLQIWHSSHGRYETQAPIRTFVPYSISGQDYVLAAYTCTPLVKIPVSELKPGAQVKGAEIADLGAGNQPLDMVPYKKGGHDYILIANTSFGVVKLKADKIETYPTISSPQRTDVAGVPYDKVSGLDDVQHITALDSSNVLVMTGHPGSGPVYNPGPPVGPINLETVALP